MAYLERGERRLHYQLLPGPSPEAPIVVYLHGLLMDNLSSGYFTFARALNQHAHVLLYDLCGHGRSLITPHGYRVYDHLADLTGLLDHVTAELTSRALFFIGCSYGGALALAAGHHLSAHTDYTPLGVTLLEGHLGHEPFLKRLHADLSATGTEADALIARHFEHWLHRGSARKRSRLAKRAHQLIYESTLLRDLKTSPLELTDESLTRTLTLPLYALYGAESDALAPVVELLERRRRLGASHDALTRFESCTHALLWEATDAVTAALVQALMCARALNTPPT